MNWFSDKRDTLTVLMYHKIIDSDRPNKLTVTRRQLEEQLDFLVNEGYTCVSLKEILNHISTGIPLAQKAILLTFDDGHKTDYTVLYQLLQQYKLKAVIFLVPALVETSKPNNESEYLNINDIRAMDDDIIEFGLHTYDHKNYNKIDLSIIEEDIIKTKTWFDLFNVKYSPVLAYTYGDFPKNDNAKLITFFNLFKKHGIQAAFAIGNRINILPIKKKFIIQRIEVRGTDPLPRFISKVKKGKIVTGFIKDILGMP